MFLRLLRCFSSAGLLPLSGYIGCPIRKSSTQRLFAPYRSLSQLITSFFASESLGIPRVLLSFFFISSLGFQGVGYRFLGFCLVSYYLISLPPKSALSLIIKNIQVFRDQELGYQAFASSPYFLLPRLLNYGFVLKFTSQ